jgi:hypothetical protein
MKVENVSSTPHSLTIKIQALRWKVRMPLCARFLRNLDVGSLGVEVPDFAQPVRQSVYEVVLWNVCIAVCDVVRKMCAKSPGLLVLLKCTSRGIR